MLTDVIMNLLDMVVKTTNDIYKAFKDLKGVFITTENNEGKVIRLYKAPLEATKIAHKTIKEIDICVSSCETDDISALHKLYKKVRSNSG